jgi:hypothetical protein
VIKARKDHINNLLAHANVLASHRIFSVDGDQANVPFFDDEDAHLVQVDLWLAGAVALDVMKLLREVNTGRNVIEFTENFDNHLFVLERRVGVLSDEMKATDRFRKAMAHGDTYLRTPTSGDKDD